MLVSASGERCNHVKERDYLIMGLAVLGDKELVQDSEFLVAEKLAADERLGILDSL